MFILQALRLPLSPLNVASPQNLASCICSALCMIRAFPSYNIASPPTRTFVGDSDATNHSVAGHLWARPGAPQLAFSLSLPKLSLPAAYTELLALSLLVLTLPSNCCLIWHTDSLLHIYTVHKNRWRSPASMLLTALLLYTRSRNIHMAALCADLSAVS